MYPDNERLSLRRSDDEFLRRLRGGEFGGGRIPLQPEGTVPVASAGGINLPPETAGNSETGYSYLSGIPGSVCKMPSLAMVYSPLQDWKGILEPDVGLSHGSIFTDLIKPLEVVMRSGGMEVNTRK